MAKSPAPFMSINARGSIAKLLTASNWKGIPYLRLLVTPSNPNTAGQQAVKLIFGSIAKAAKAVLTSFTDSMHVGSPFFVAARDAAPSGQSWISFVQQYSYSIAASIDSGWTALGGTKQGYFENTASDVGLSDYTPSFTSDPGYTNGKQLYALARFASVNLLGDVGDLADLAIAGANQGAVDDFGDAVHLTS
jgi:hypothetical protein